MPDYVPVPFNALVKRTVKKHGQMVDVPEGNGVYTFRKLLDAHPEAPPAVTVAPDDTALFQYTGGTTGVPKAAMLTHYNLVVNTVQVKNWMRTLEDGKERMMGAIPFFHVYGMTVSMSLAMLHGRPVADPPQPAAHRRRDEGHAQGTGDGFPRRARNVHRHHQPSTGEGSTI